MISRWLAASLAGLSLMGAAAAQADILNTAAAQVQEITGELKTREGTQRARENPMYACYKIGRLQGVSDRLAKDIERIESFPGLLTVKQNEVITLSRNFYVGLEKQLAQGIEDKGCDPQASTRLAQLNPAGKSTSEHIRLAIAAIKTMSAEDQVIRCLYVGRLSSLNDRFRADISAISRKGKRVLPQVSALYREARSIVVREYKDCGLR